jgi:hypothetical protein
MTTRDNSIIKHCHVLYHEKEDMIVLLKTQRKVRLGHKVESHTSLK